MATFFTADTHFGDRHILRHRGARFATIEAHDEALIARWNATVGPDDDVWHVGDFAADASRDHCAAVFARLNGRKHLVRGNHDTNRVLELPWSEPPVESLRLTVHDAEGREWRWFLAHYPHRAWPGLWRRTRHLHGHTHARLVDMTRSCDVGVDAWDYHPVGIAALVARQDAATVVPEELLLKAAEEAGGPVAR
jgi:calcineurin-like phosphoesterase family protein